MNREKIAEKALHGDVIECPTCGAPGRRDKLPGHEPEFENWIDYNKEEQIWDCWECWLK